MRLIESRCAPRGPSLWGWLRGAAIALALATTAAPGFALTATILNPSPGEVIHVFRKPDAYTLNGTYRGPGDLMVFIDREEIATSTTVEVAKGLATVQGGAWEFPWDLYAKDMTAAPGYRYRVTLRRALGAPVIAEQLVTIDAAAAPAGRVDIHSSSVTSSVYVGGSPNPWLDGIGQPLPSPLAVPVPLQLRAAAGTGQFIDTAKIQADGTSEKTYALDLVNVNDNGGTTTGAPPADVTTGIPYSFNLDNTAAIGKRTISVTYTQDDGAAASASRNVILDYTNPMIGVTKDPTYPAKGVVRLSGSVSDAGAPGIAVSGIAQVHVCLVNEDKKFSVILPALLSDAEGDVDGAVWTVDYTPAKDAPSTYDVYLEVLDNAGNRSVKHVMAANGTEPPQFKIDPALDTTPPTAAINSPANDTFAGTDSATVNITVADAGSDASGVESWTLYLNDKVVKTGSAGVTNAPHLVSGLVSGRNTLRLEAADVAGNTAAPAVVTILRDSDKPVVQITSPADKQWTRVPLDVTGVVNDANIKNWTLTQDGDSASARTGNANAAGVLWKDWKPADGKHTLALTATDLAGNSGTAGVETWVDTTAPVAAITAPANNTILPPSKTIPSIAVTVTATDDASASGVKAWTLYVNDVKGPSGTSAAAGTVAHVATLVNGPNVLRLEVEDVAGNKAVPSVVTVVTNLDATKPTVRLANPPDAMWVGTPIRITGEVSDANLKSWALTQKDGPTLASGGAADVPANGVLKDGWTPANGKYTLTLHAEDLAGNVNDTSITAWVDSSAPKPTLGWDSATSGKAADNVLSGVAGISPAFGNLVETADSGVKNWLFHFDAGAGASASGSLAKSNGTAADALPVAWDTSKVNEGPRSLQLQVTDEAGNVGVSAPLNIIVDRTAPAPVITTVDDQLVVAVNGVKTLDKPVKDTVAVSGDAGDLNPATWALTYSESKNGPYKLIAASDPARPNTGAAFGVWNTAVPFPKTLANVWIRLSVTDKAENGSDTVTDGVTQATRGVHSEPVLVIVDNSTQEVNVSVVDAYPGSATPIYLRDQDKVYTTVPTIQATFRLESLDSWALLDNETPLANGTQKDLTNGKAAASYPLSYNSGKDGAHTFRARVKYTSGSQFEGFVSAVVDTIAPAVVISSPEDMGAVTGQFTLTGTADDANLEKWTVAVRREGDAADLDITAGPTSGTTREVKVNMDAADLLRQLGNPTDKDGNPDRQTVSVTVTATDKVGHITSVKRSIVLTPPGIATTHSAAFYLDTEEGLLAEDGQAAFPDMSGWVPTTDARVFTRGGADRQLNIEAELRHWFQYIIRDTAHSNEVERFPATQYPSAQDNPAPGNLLPVPQKNPITKADGRYQWSIVAVDASGKESVPTSRMDVTLDTMAPTLQVYSPVTPAVSGAAQKFVGVQPQRVTPGSTLSLVLRVKNRDARSVGGSVENQAPLEDPLNPVQHPLVRFRIFRVRDGQGRVVNQEVTPRISGVDGLLGFDLPTALKNQTGRPILNGSAKVTGNKWDNYLVTWNLPITGDYAMGDYNITFFGASDIIGNVEVDPTKQVVRSFRVSLR